jgi:hypothetical protein
MKRVRIALLLAVALSLAAYPAAGMIKNNEAMITGKVLYAMCTNADPDIGASCATFVRGFLEGAKAAAETTKAKPFFCIPESATTDLVILAFTREVERLPRTSMDDTAGNVLANALWVGFPCTASN